MRNPAFLKLLDEIRALHDGKSHDYAGSDPLSNLRMCEAFGVPAWKGVLVRLSDKYSRLAQLAGGKTPKNESLRDTLIDNAVYSLLAVLLLDEQSPVQESSGFIPNERPQTLNTDHEPESVGQFGCAVPDFAKLGR